MINPNPKVDIQRIKQEAFEAVYPYNADETAVKLSYVILDLIREIEILEMTNTLLAKAAAKGMKNETI